MSGVLIVCLCASDIIHVIFVVQENGHACAVVFYIL